MMERMSEEEGKEMRDEADAEAEVVPEIHIRADGFGLMGSLTNHYNTESKKRWQTPTLGSP